MVIVYQNAKYQKDTFKIDWVVAAANSLHLWPELPIMPKFTCFLSALKPHKHFKSEDIALKHTILS